MCKMTWFKNTLTASVIDKPKSFKVCSALAFTDGSILICKVSVLAILITSIGLLYSLYHDLYTKAIQNIFL